MLVAPSKPMVAAAGDAAQPYTNFDVPVWMWLSLVAAIVVMLVVDLLLVHRSAHVITLKEAAVESAVWISLGLAVPYCCSGRGARRPASTTPVSSSRRACRSTTSSSGLSSSRSSGCPASTSSACCSGGSSVRWCCAASSSSPESRSSSASNGSSTSSGLSCSTRAWKIAHHDESEQVDYNANIAMRLVRRVVPTTLSYDGQKLFTREHGRRLATPLFAVLVLIEATDLVFAVDSVPAILAVSREPFIVFAANAFAILGLRSLYFLLGGMQGKFRYLNVGLGVILAFVGIKMLLVGEPFEVHLPTYGSLGFIAAVITASIVASVRADARESVQSVGR